VISNEDVKRIGDYILAKMHWDMCPECGALGMACAKMRREDTVCGVTGRPIKDANLSWEDWLKEHRGPEPVPKDP